MGTPKAESDVSGANDRTSSASAVHHSQEGAGSSCCRESVAWMVDELHNVEDHIELALWSVHELRQLERNSLLTARGALRLLNALQLQLRKRRDGP